MERDIKRAAQYILDSKYVVALTGAGVSVESGIRPFRGPGGLWTEFGEPPLDGYQRFLADPKDDWEKRLRKEGYARELYETFEKASPNLAHFSLSQLEQMGVLQYLITQNVDNLHRSAGSQKIAEIHGNLFLLRCIDCNARYPREEISLEVLPPSCPKCQGIIKTDGVMFGEPIPRDVLKVCDQEANKSDCILSIGTSAFVYPAAEFPQRVKGNSGKLIEVDPYETSITSMCDISLRGRAGEIMPQLVSAIQARLTGN